MDFLLFDADNHYYEAADCFTRHGDEVVRRYVTWVEEGRKRHLLFGNQRTNDSRNPGSVMNPTFSRVAKPGAFHEVLKDFELGGTGSLGSWYGELEAPSEGYSERSARLAIMDDQGVERVMLFPTLGLTVEGYQAHDADLMYRVLHAFNLWLDDDWGLNRDDRIYCPPVISMKTVEGAVGELEWALSRGSKVITIQPGPAYGRSPADTYFDPFWALVNESGVLVAYHAAGGPTAYQTSFDRMWGQETADRGYLDLFRMNINSFEQPIMDTARALILGNLFGRFPNIRMASVEMGGNWVPYLLHALDHAGSLLTRSVRAFGTVLRDRPSDVFKDRFWVAPFPEEDVVGLTEVLGADHVLMGSDWPHPEGNPTPGAYVDCLAGLDETKIRRVMRENAMELLTA